ncbi:MAG: DUF418 domain-containing protein [Aquimonas sp.]|nr:DUF418 domain-containing protein [Aquimonas sp.]
MQRRTDVDVLRGFALLGIGVVNLPYLALPLADQLGPPGGGLDAAAYFIGKLLFEGKFFVLFSFLFGWGFGAQLNSAERAGMSPRRRYLARLVALALFGVLHALLVFQGDILLAYACLGLLLWPLRQAPPKRLLWIAAAMLPVSALSFALLYTESGSVEDLVALGLDPGSEGYRGGYLQTVGQRLAEWPFALAVVVLFNGPLAFAAFCLGLAAYRAGFLDARSAGFQQQTRRIPILLGIALAANLLFATAQSGWLPESSLIEALAAAALALGAPSLGALYLWFAVRHASRFRALGAIGSMPLTGYVLQGVLAGALFHGWGLGLFGQLGHAALLGVAALIWLALLLFATAWRRYREQGPLDAVLRALARRLGGVTPRAGGGT